MAIDVQYVGSVQLRARRDQQVRDRNPMAAGVRKLALRARRRRERLSVHPQLAELAERRADPLIVVGGAGATSRIAVRCRCRRSVPSR